MLLLEKRKNLGDFQYKLKTFKKTEAKLSKLAKKIQIIYKNMPKLNPYLIENKAQIEEVREIENKELITPEEQAKLVDKLIKNEILSYEEFMKTYQEDEGVSDNYYYEIDSYGDIRVVKCYGPGNNQSNLSDDEKKVLVGASVVGAVALTVVTAGVAAPIAAKGVDAVMNYASSQGGSDSGSGSNSNMHMGSGSVARTSKTGSPVWQSLKPYHGNIRTNGLSGSSRSYFT